MPELNTPLHMDMLTTSKKSGGLLVRLVSAIKKEVLSPNIYGMEWCDPDLVAPLKFFKERYLDPYVRSDQTALEIGPGGGRWTQYLLGFKQLYIVDYHSELLDELKKNFRRPNMLFVKNNGTDFPGVAAGSIDYVFSFGVFVHLDVDIIEAYLRNLTVILKPGANVVIQYSDKNKVMAQLISGFSENTPEKMRQMVLTAGYNIVEEDVTTLWHSSIIRFTKHS